ncbi:MAG: S-layer homology domain-containing protein [Eubacteriales bacterium]
MKKNIRLTAALLAVLTLFPAARVYETPVYSVSAAQTNISVSNEASTLFFSLAQKLLDATPSLQPGSIGGDWSVMILAKAGLLTDDMADKYYSNVWNMWSREGILSTNRSTDYSRVILALVDRARPSDVGGYDLLSGLSDFAFVTKQDERRGVGAYRSRFPRIRDSVDIGKGQDNRDKLISHILSFQKKDGNLSDIEGCDPEYTAMALLALSNYRDRKDVKTAIDNGIKYLAAAQNERGGYPSKWGESSETTSQIIMALASVGVSPDDSRFTKSGKSLWDNLLSYRAGDGFAHAKIKGNYEYNRMGTEQALLALSSAAKISSFPFDFSSVRENNRPVGGKSGLPGKNKDVKVPGIKGDVTFPDIWGENAQTCTTAVCSLASRGIISGYEDGNFKPERTLTRAEFAALIVRALGLEAKSDAKFSDVPKTAWYARSVAAASEYGLILGIGDNRFLPDGTITREEAAVICARAAVLCGVDTERSDAQIRDTLSVFSDYTTSSKWARAGLAFAVDSNMLDAEAVNLRPKDKTTRAEAAIMLHAMLGAAKLI